MKIRMVLAASAALVSMALAQAAERAPSELDPVFSAALAAPDIESKEAFERLQRAYLAAQEPGRKAAAAEAAARQRSQGETPVASGGGSGNCLSQKKTMDDEFNLLNARRPAGATMTQNLQVVMYMTSKALALADGACKGHAVEPELRTGMQAAFDQSKKNCIAVSTSPDANCVPRKPW